MIVALHSELQPGTAERYDREHARIPADLAVSFARVGISEWRIWRSGERLFHLVECEDFDAAMAALDTDPANQRWQAQIGAVVRRFSGPEGSEGMSPLVAVWALSTQREVPLETELPT
ncbi:L-rhamnose mutarotase [Leucobacter sp. M11]|uniref:L-rhamnose mutarotase n=1 Tax=Leucobacter sp. M11 TaxID=2993565 RepID=UPI002D805976|nr:L-rhamnose mutarotase [Leucobacter sp. M11]MEB4615112.1 L-rhamnose mutarotase [Leucobacter sp. M11]